MSTVTPNLTHECVLELLKLSSNVNECKPLPVRGDAHPAQPSAPFGLEQPARGGVGQVVVVPGFGARAEAPARLVVRGLRDRGAGGHVLLGHQGEDVTKEEGQL